MNENDVFVLADRTLQGVVDQIGHDQWEMTMPPDFARTDEGPITLRQVINHHAYDDAWVPDLLAGRTMDEVGADAYQGDLLGADPGASFAAIVDRACESAASLDDLERTVHCSFGDFSAREYLCQINSFRGLRAHDLAQVIGVSTVLPDELVHALWDELEPRADHWRQWGVFGPRVDVPDGATLQDRLLALTGRRPDATTL